MEKYSKKMMKCKCNLDTSSQPPGYYAERFMKFSKIIFKF